MPDTPDKQERLATRGRWPSPDQRFCEKFMEQADGCWIWQGEIRGGGYTRFRVNGGQQAAHRWAYERFIGPIPEGLQLDHLCRNRACVNPGHLEVVTNRINTLRGFAARREAIRQLWEAATGHWDHSDELFDSSVAFPGLPVKGGELWRIGIALGLVEADAGGYPREDPDG